MFLLDNTISSQLVWIIFTRRTCDLLRGESGSGSKQACSHCSPLHARDPSAHITMWDNEQCTPGFAFDRADSSSKLRATKTGTTICGAVFSTGVVLGADTRSTNGETVADKNCQKIHYLAPNVYCCGAGTAADTENVTGDNFL